jgi:hypothetical protein
MAQAKPSKFSGLETERALGEVSLAIVYSAISHHNVELQQGTTRTVI